MTRIKQTRKINHEPSTHEIFTCLSQMVSYSKILLDSNPDKPYVDFLSWLLEVNFHKDSEEKISIKKLAADYKIQTAKVTKWIADIYQDIFEINWDKPELFYGSGVKVTLYMKHYDDHCSFCITMPVVPREFEEVRFYFAKAKMGIDFFWVKKVEHEVRDDGIEVTIWLQGGFLNKYREFALHKALFQGWIGFMDEFDKHTFELDEEQENTMVDEEDSHPFPHLQQFQCPLVMVCRGRSTST